MEKEEINLGGNRDENKKCDCITTLYIMFVIIATVMMVFMVTNIEGWGDTTKVLGFFGIIAAFVVVSNYAQMVEVRNQTDKRIRELEDKLENMNANVNGITRAIETDRDKIYSKFDGVEKMIYADQGLYYRYYVIKCREGYKMVETRGNYVFELSFQKFLSRYDDKTIKKMFRQMLKDFGVPEKELDE